MENRRYLSREDTEVEFGTAIQEKPPLPCIDGNTKDGISTSIPEPALSPPKENPKWEIQPCRRRKFDKVGGFYLEGGGLIIRSDLDHRLFRVPLVDVDAVLKDNPRVSDGYTWFRIRNRKINSSR